MTYENLTIAIKEFVANEKAFDAARVDYYAAHQQIQSAVFSAIADLTAEFTTEAAKTLYKVLEPLGQVRLKSLLGTRLYAEDGNFTTAEQFITIKAEKGILDVKNHVRPVWVQAFADGENITITPKPAENCKKAGSVKEAFAIMENGKYSGQPPVLTKPKAEKSENRRAAANLKKYAAGIEKILSNANETQLKTRFQVLKAELDKLAAEIEAADDVGSLSEAA